jgi:hypothetical protein
MSQARINRICHRSTSLGQDCFRVFFGDPAYQSRGTAHSGRRRAAILNKSPYDWEMSFQHTKNGVANTG